MRLLNVEKSNKVFSILKKYFFMIYRKIYEKNEKPARLIIEEFCKLSFMIM